MHELLSMSFDAQFLVALGVFLLAGLSLSALGKRTALPRVTLLLLLGVAVGKHGLDLVPAFLIERFDLFAEIALIMVGFLLGGKLTSRSVSHDAKPVLVISIMASVVTTIFVSTVLILLGFDTVVSIMLGCIAAATDAAAVLDVVMESKSESRFSRILLSITALDDAWALILFALGVATVSFLLGHSVGLSAIGHALYDIGGAVLLGLVIGLPAAQLTGRLQPGQPMLSEALGVVFLCGGLALMFQVSFLIAAMVMGAVIANMARHHEYPFHEIEHIEGQVMVIFFVLAGASLDLESLKTTGLLGVLYILMRAAGKILGGYLGSQISGLKGVEKNWMGVALLPQAGVAIGMGLVASSYFPQIENQVLTVVIATTVFFEIVGPIFSRQAISRSS